MSNETLMKIEKLKQELTSLNQQRDSFKKEALQWATKRDTINKQIKDLRLEATSIKERRDNINMRVKTLKTRRDQARALIKAKIEESKKLGEKLRLLNAKRPIQPAEALKREKEKLEWTIQTSSLTVQEERPLVEKANQLGTQLNIHHQIGDVKGRIAEGQSIIKTSREEAKLFHTQLTELAYQSQQLHLKMIEVLDKVKALQAEADTYHHNFVQNKQRSQQFHEKHIEVENQIRTLNQQLTEKEDREKALEQAKTREKLKTEALKRLKKGEKLTFQEFKLLEDEDTP